MKYPNSTQAVLITPPDETALQDIDRYTTHTEQTFWNQFLRESPGLKSKATQQPCGIRRVMASSWAFGHKLSTYIWAKLRNVACRPPTVWLITVRGQASNQHSSTLTHVSKHTSSISTQKCTYFANDCLGHSYRELPRHKKSVLKPSIFKLLFDVADFQSKSFKWQMSSTLTRPSHNNTVGVYGYLIITTRRLKSW